MTVGDRRVTINSRSDFGRGPDRFAVLPEDASRAQPVSANVEGHAHGDHSRTCEAKS